MENWNVSSQIDPEICDNVECHFCRNCNAKQNIVYPEGVASCELRVFHIGHIRNAIARAFYHILRASFISEYAVNISETHSGTYYPPYSSCIAVFDRIPIIPTKYLHIKWQSLRFMHRSKNCISHNGIAYANDAGACTRNDIGCMAATYVDETIYELNKFIKSEETFTNGPIVTFLARCGEMPAQHFINAMPE